MFFVSSALCFTYWHFFIPFNFIPCLCLVVLSVVFVTVFLKLFRLSVRQFTNSRAGFQRSTYHPVPFLSTHTVVQTFSAVCPVSDARVHPEHYLTRLPPSLSKSNMSQHDDCSPYPNSVCVCRLTGVASSDYPVTG